MTSPSHERAVAPCAGAEAIALTLPQWLREAPPQTTQPAGAVEVRGVNSKLLMRGPRNGGKGSGGKAAQPAASVRLVARKVAERLPFFQIRVRGHALFHCAARLGTLRYARRLSTTKCRASLCLLCRRRSASPALPRRACSAHPVKRNVPCHSRCVAVSRAPQQRLTTPGR